MNTRIVCTVFLILLIYLLVHLTALCGLLNVIWHQTLFQWRTCGGRSHDRLQLEFRATRWSLVVPTVAAMREVGLALWEILQELDSHFLEEHALLRRFGQQGKNLLQKYAKFC